VESICVGRDGDEKIADGAAGDARRCAPGAALRAPFVVRSLPRSFARRRAVLSLPYIIGDNRRADDRRRVVEMNLLLRSSDYPLSPASVRFLPPARSELLKVLFLAPSVCVFLPRDAAMLARSWES